MESQFRYLIRKNISNGYINFDDPTMSTIVGLLFYSLDKNRNFELDSNKELRKKAVEQEVIVEEPQVKEKRRTQPKDSKPQAQKLDVNVEDPTQLPKISEKDKGKGMTKFWNKVSEWF